jgi:hypothetical protein
LATEIMRGLRHSMTCPLPEAIGEVNVGACAQDRMCGECLIQVSLVGVIEVDH